MLFKPFPQNLLSISLSLPEVSNSRDVGSELRIENNTFFSQKSPIFPCLSRNKI
jgi:hypothetical protein